MHGIQDLVLPIIQTVFYRLYREFDLAISGYRKPTGMQTDVHPDYANRVSRVPCLRASVARGPNMPRAVTRDGPEGAPPASDLDHGDTVGPLASDLDVTEM